MQATALRLCLQGDLQGLKAHFKRKRVDIDARVHGKTPLCAAAAAGHSNVVHYLLTKGADPDIGEPLRLAILHGHLEVVKALVLGGSTVKDRDIEFAEEQVESMTCPTAAGCGCECGFHRARRSIVAICRDPLQGYMSD